VGIRRTAELLSGFPTEKKIEILSVVCETIVEDQRKINVPKIYVCRTWPQLTIGKVRFRNGLFVTNDPELHQRTVEKAHGFGVQIQELRNHMEPKDFEEVGRAEQENRDRTEIA